MGNQKSFQQFNPNFDFVEYNRKLDKIRNQYGQNDQLNSFNYNIAPTSKKKPQTINCQQIKRNAYLFKPSLEIEIEKDGKVKIQFNYDSENDSQIIINIGVSQINQNKQTKKTQQVVSKVEYKDELKTGNKIKYNNTINIQNFSKKQLEGQGILIRIFYVNSQQQQQQFGKSLIPRVVVYKKEKSMENSVVKILKGQLNLLNLGYLWGQLKSIVYYLFL